MSAAGWLLGPCGPETQESWENPGNRRSRFSSLCLPWGHWTESVPGPAGAIWSGRGEPEMSHPIRAALGPAWSGLALQTWGRPTSATPNAYPKPTPPSPALLPISANAATCSLPFIRSFVRSFTE